MPTAKVPQSQGIIRPHADRQKRKIKIKLIIDDSVAKIRGHNDLTVQPILQFEAFYFILFIFFFSPNFLLCWWGQNA